MSFDAFTADIQNNNWNVFGVELYENGKLTHSFGDTNEKLNDCYSTTKSILSVAAGIVYDMGLLDLDRSILAYMPKKHVEKMPVSQVQIFESVTVRRLLCMSVKGLPFAAEGESFIDFSLACKVEPEDIGFNYSNISAYLVGVALAEILGEDLGAFIEKRIFEPMGITRFEYGRCPEGYFYGASKMKLTVHDLSKFGILMMNGGVYDGHRIISEKYVNMATGVQQMNREGGYGFFFWKYRDGFSINGKCGQKCYCLPNRGLMLTFMSYMEETPAGFKESMERNIMNDAKDVLKGLLDSKRIHVDLRKEVSSTNKLVKTMGYAGEDEGYLMIAESQTEGRGRLGRSFFSPDGTGLYMSLLLQPNCKAEKATRITTIAAVAVTEAIRGLTGKEAGIKWVNDIFLNGKKVCGILTESVLQPGTDMMDFAVLGIGVNLTEPKEGFDAEIKEIAGAIYPYGAAPEFFRERLAAEIVNRFFELYGNLDDISIVKRYQTYSVMTGRAISIIDDITKPEAARKATALGIDDNFGLIVELSDGTRETLTSGDVSLRLV